MTGSEWNEMGKTSSVNNIAVVNSGFDRIA
jgi:hypothetical protein